MELTRRQQQVLGFIQAEQRQAGRSPSLREIARHFGFQSMTAAQDHVRALCRKGALAHQARQARGWQVVSPLQNLRRPLVDIPIYGSIPAGYAEDRPQEEAKGCLTVDVESLGLRTTARTFALQVRGDSMTGRHIIDGDYVVFEHGLEPRPGDVVAALIDNESTIKTFVVDRGRPCLRAENPQYPQLIPAAELVIQGVMMALVRKGKRAT